MQGTPRWRLMDGASTAVPSVRILLVGDSGVPVMRPSHRLVAPVDAFAAFVAGVGKTTLLRRLCPETASQAPGWTVGANLGTLVGLGMRGRGRRGRGLTRVRQLMSPESTGAGDGLFVDILDVGGHDRFRLSRSVFYHNAHGIMLVYDATNRKSYHNLRRWMAELLAARQFGRSVVDPSVGRQARAVAERSEVAVRCGRWGREADPAPATSRPRQLRVASWRATRLQDPTVPFLVRPHDGQARGPAESGPAGAAATLRNLPILVVGTKADQLGPGASRAHGPSRPFRAVEPVEAFEHVLTVRTAAAPA